VTWRREGREFICGQGGCAIRKGGLTLNVATPNQQSFFEEKVDGSCRYSSSYVKLKVTQSSLRLRRRELHRPRAPEGWRLGGLAALSLSFSILYDLVSIGATSESGHDIDLQTRNARGTCDSRHRSRVGARRECKQ